MNEDTETWTAVAEIESGTTDYYEEADDIQQAFDSHNVRCIEVMGQDTAYIEVNDDTGNGWVRVATFDGSEAYYDAETVKDALDDEMYRIVMVKHGDVAMEKRVSNE